MAGRATPTVPEGPLETARRLRLLCPHCGYAIGFSFDEHGYHEIVEGVVMERFIHPTNRDDWRIVHHACHQAAVLLEKVEGKHTITLDDVTILKSGSHKDDIDRLYNRFQVKRR